MRVWTVHGGVAGPRGAVAGNVLAVKESTNATVQVRAATGKHQLAAGFLDRCSRLLRQAERSPVNRPWNDRATGSSPARSQIRLTAILPLHYLGLALFCRVRVRRCMASGALTEGRTICGS
jgi:hypothetical protein